MGALDMPPGAEAGGGFMVAPEGCNGASGFMPADALLGRGVGTWVVFTVGTEGGGMGVDCGCIGGGCGEEGVGEEGVGDADAGLESDVAGGGGARVALAVVLLPFSLGVALNLARVFRYCSSRSMVALTPLR